MANHSELHALVAKHARNLGPNQASIPGLRFFRAERPFAYEKSQCPTLHLGVVVQGRKVARVEGRELHYDAESYLVITGEAQFEGRVVEASPERPYLALGLLLPPEQVVKWGQVTFQVVPPSCVTEAASPRAPPNV